MEKSTAQSEAASVGTLLKKLLYKRVHILQWLPSYTRNDVLADMIAGLTVGLTMMPQSLAYAGLSGVPSQYGLYTAFIGSFTYVIFGTVKEVSIGPTSLMAILTFSYSLPIEAVILMTFLAGCVELLMGILNLGFMVDFISPCLTSGFTSASATIIVVSQMKHLLGIGLKHHDTFGVLKELTERYQETRMADCLLGLGCIAFLLCFKQLNKINVHNPSLKKFFWFLSISKNALIVLITSVVGACLAVDGVAPFKLTGSVPKGMPDFGFPSLTAVVGNETLGFKEMVMSMGSGVIVIPVVAVLANVAIAKAYSTDVVVDASQEMITLGLCNLLGSFVKALPSCGAFTRSSVASSSDVRTPLQGMYSGTLIVLALSFLAPYFFFIPKATLAAVLIVAASSLIDYEIFPVLWKCNRLDFFLTLFTLIIGIIHGVQTAIVIGALCNVFVLLKIWSRPRIAVEVKEKGESRYIYVKPELGLLYPGADCLTEFIKKHYNRNDRLPVVLDCCNVLRLDYSAAMTLASLLISFNEDKTSLVLINLDPNIFSILETVTDTPHLQLCHASDELSEIIFEDNRADEEKSLLRGRRRSSVRPSRDGERRLSAYDLE